MQGLAMHWAYIKKLSIWVYGDFARLRLSDDSTARLSK